jgi:medium-chain acyl-[acyl-carrier-protein] hydrolase
VDEPHLVHAGAVRGRGGALVSGGALLARLAAREGARCAVVCFPGAGAGAGVFVPWTRLVPDDVALWAVRLPGRESRLREPPFRSLGDAADAAAAALREGPDLPLVLLGHSMGGLLAFETARRLEADAGRRPLLLAAAASRAPLGPSAGGRFHQMEDEQLARVMAATSGMPDAVGMDASLRQMAVSLLRADLAMVEAYAGADAPLQAPIAVYAGRADPGVDAAEVERWRACSRAEVRIHWFDGGHFFLREQPEPVVRRLMEDVRALLPPEG